MEEISVILNVYKRPHSLDKQIEAVLNQTVKIKPENIHVWFNKSDIRQNLPINKNVKTYVTNWNSKFHGRFTIPLLIRTPYIAMFDDDTIPGNKWFENCLTTMKKHNGILGSSGVIINSKAYRPHSKAGWTGTHSDGTMRVDLVGHGWFFKQEWAKYMWYEKPVSWDNGEDIMFSYLAQKYGGINTFVPPHPESDREMWGNLPERDGGLGNDNVASFKINADHYGLRDLVCSKCIDKGWNTVHKIK